MRDPPPLITLGDIDGQSVAVELAFRVADAGKIIAAKNEMLDLIFRHLKSEKLELVTAIASPAFVQVGPAANANASIVSQRDIVRSLPLFGSLTDEELDMLSADLSKRVYSRGAEIMHQGEKSPTLMIVAQGVAVVEKVDAGAKTELNRLSPGDFFGERGLLMGAEEPGNIRALSSVLVYEVSPDCIGKMLRDRPDLADEISLTLAARLDAEAAISGEMTPVAHHPLTIANRIRHLFQIQAARKN